jgi:2-polyprenyl-6-methoxyphenol hydroxylase-like FAD-dependent oxidoreductase
VQVFESESSQVRLGHGFIVQDNGLRVLESLGLGTLAEERGHRLTTVELRATDGTVRRTAPMHRSVGMLRRDLIDVLKAPIPRETIALGHHAEGLEWDANGFATAVRFRDGTTYAADLVVAADGIHSALCRALFPQATLTAPRVKELVCHTRIPELTDELQHTFRKYQAADSGLALGLVPCGDDRIVWYLQVDARIWSAVDPEPAAMTAFVANHLGDWHAPVERLLRHTDFRLAHLWPTRDRDPLPALHHRNVVLVGDAAHPLLPFTSQGIGAALDDAVALAACLAQHPNDLPAALAAYSAERLPQIARLVTGGRALQEEFLSPQEYRDRPSTPLVS